MELWGGGLKRLVVEDDGEGIPLEDLPLAVEPYATSKLQDLEGIRTLGFRGQALYALRQAARLRIRSRPRGQLGGGLLLAEGERVEVRPVPAPPGNKQQADTGTKMVHLAPNTRSRIISKGISTGNSSNSYRGLVKISAKAENTKNYSQCDSLLIGKNSSANTFPYIEAQNSYTRVEHEASTSRIAEEQLFYLLQRGIDTEEAVSLMVNGFCKEVFNELPLEFASEADRLLSLKLEGSVG